MTVVATVMTDGIHTNINAIQDMEAACDRFARTVAEKLPCLERELQRARETLDSRRDELRHEVVRLQEAISSADEDEDTSWARSRIEFAEEEYALVQRHARQLEEAGAVFEAQSQKIDHLATGHTVRTKEFLRGTVDDLRAYFAYTLNSTSHNYGSKFVTSAANNPTANVVGATGNAAFDPTAFVLPAGFVWVHLDQVDFSLDRGGFENADKFEKVPREEMVRGFNALCNEILPAISKHSTAVNSFYFAKLDQIAGRQHESGLERPFSAFFGDDHIYVTRRSNTELWNVTGGRHRILVARQLGWTAVPAKVSGPG